MNEDTTKYSILGLRLVQLVGALAFVVGVMWQGVVSFNWSVQQFMMAYGATWALTAEAIIQLLKWRARKQQKQGKFRVKRR